MRRSEAAEAGGETEAQVRNAVLALKHMVLACGIKDAQTPQDLSAALDLAAGGWARTMVRERFLRDAVTARLHDFDAQSGLHDAAYSLAVTLAVAVAPAGHRWIGELGYEQLFERRWHDDARERGVEVIPDLVDRLMDAQQTVLEAMWQRGLVRLRGDLLALERVMRPSMLLFQPIHGAVCVYGRSLAR